MAGVGRGQVNTGFGVKPEGKRHLEDLRVDNRLTLK